jgi:hypothetical protein
VSRTPGQFCDTKFVCGGCAPLHALKSRRDWAVRDGCARLHLLGLHNNNKCGSVIYCSQAKPASYRQLASRPLTNLFHGTSMDPMDTKPDGNESDSDHDSDHEQDSPEHHAPHGSTAHHRVAKLERDKRTYRACLHCRQRKSRCDL